MAYFVLVHGAWQGAWCWSEVVPLLTGMGHTALAIDLPGHGDQPAALEQITLGQYAETVIKAVASAPARPIVVVHSMGALLAHAAEMIPNRIQAIVFLSAIVPDNGRSMLQVIDGFDPEYLSQICFSDDRRTARMGYRGAREFLYERSPGDLVDKVFARFTPEPLAPFETAVWTTQENFGTVPAYYIECLHDRVAPLSLQRRTQGRLFCRRVFSLDADHSPFLSKPAEFSACLDAIAADLT